MNVNMADAAAARREARRKRILENSHNRLQLISGKCGDDVPGEFPIRAVNPEQDCDIPLSSGTNSRIEAPISNGVIVTESESFDLLSLNHDIAAGDGEVPSDLASFISTAQEPPQQSSIWEKLTLYRYDVVVLSLIIQLLHSVSLVTFDDTYLFLPLIIYVITKLIWFPSQNSNSKLGNVLQLLQGMSSRRVQIMIHVTQCFGVISRDVCVFLFTTICVQSLLITLKDGLVT